MKRGWMLFILGMGCLWCEAQSNALSERRWLPFMKKAMERETYHYENRSYYKGQFFGEVPSGLGVYLSRDGSWYWGRWKNGDMNGKAIYIAPAGCPDSHCPECVYYVGDFRADKKAGVGTCYDKYGKLIYRGSFSDGRPTDVCPSTKDTECTFGCLKYGGGDMYLGEMKNGIRHGAGIYLRSDGGAWYGSWKNDKREGEGIFLPYVGEFLAGRWKEGVYEKWKDTDASGGSFSSTGSGESNEEAFAKVVGYYEAGNNSEASRLFRQLAKKGYVNAQYVLGDCYENGEGVAKDGNKALYWYKKCLKSGKADETMRYFARERIARLERRGYSAARAGVE